MVIGIRNRQSRKHLHVAYHIQMHSEQHVLNFPLWPLSYSQRHRVRSATKEIELIGHFVGMLGIKKIITSCSNIAYSPSVFWRTIAMSMSFWRATTPRYDLHSTTFTNKSNSLRRATFRDTVSVSSLFVSMLPTHQCRIEYKMFDWKLVDTIFECHE